jgi:hypothetical protein
LISVPASDFPSAESGAKGHSSLRPALLIGR